jgi:ABC-type branched-subunit amino acid transport system substrate-binding protein
VVPGRRAAKKRLRVKSAFAASVVGLLLVAACSSNVPPPQPPVQQVEPVRPKEIKVGLMLPLSGPAAGLGQDMLQAAQMALFDVGANDVVLLPRDTGGTPEGARRAANGLIAEQVEIIIGPLFSQAVQATSPIARAAGIPVLAFSNVTSVATADTYLLGFRPEEQVTRVVQFALEHVERGSDEIERYEPGGAVPPPNPQSFGLMAENAGPVRIAGLAPNDAYGATALQALRRAVIAGGGELAMTAFYPPDLADPSAVVRQVADFDRRQAALERERSRVETFEDDAGALRELQRLATLDTLGGPPFDAILIADGDDRLRSVASLLTFYDVDPDEVRFLGTMRWQDDPLVLEEAALRQGWFAALAPETMAAFRNRYERAFGSQPQQLAALAYDATALVVIVARDLGDRDFDPLTLTNPEGFSGATGLFRLRPDGLADHGLAILEVDGTATRAIDPAPSTLVDQLASQQAPFAPSGATRPVLPEAPRSPLDPPASSTQ